MYTTQQLADYLKLARQTIIVYIHRGKIEAKKLGRDWVISQKEARRIKLEMKEKTPTDLRRQRSVVLRGQSQPEKKNVDEQQET